MTHAETYADWQTGPLRAEELAAVVAIDAAMTGRNRGAFYARRLARTLAAPARFVHVGLRREGAIVGFALARLTDGEFGEPDRGAALDALAIHPGHQGGGGGPALIAALLAVLARKGVARVVTEVDWEALSLCGFLAASGFAPAEQLLVERALAPGTAF